MDLLWKLVLIAVFSIGLSNGSDLENIGDLNKEESRQITFLTSSDITSTAKFQCHNKPSGYYADPRFDCKVFHFCHEDGTKITIPCISESERHSICTFRDITFNACEGSEIYLALPENLHGKPPKDTTASAINSATDFRLPHVLPLPNSPFDNNQSTTPLSLEFRHETKSNSLGDAKEARGIFEVFNSILREIQAEENEKNIPDNSELLKVSPSTFSRGSKFQASAIRRDDSDDAFLNNNRRSDGPDTLLVEVYNDKNEKFSDNNSYNKKSKGLFFSLKQNKKTPGTHPRRKKRMVAEPLNVSRPFAVIYAKVPDVITENNPNIVRKSSNERQDVIEVPFVAARVPVDVPTVPITIETRRKKKSKSKKKAKTIPQTFYIEEHFPEETGQQHTSEQQNVLYFAREQMPSIGFHDVHNRGVIDDQHRPRQNSGQIQHETQRNNAQSPQNSLQENFQTPVAPQNSHPFRLPNFPFQSTLLSNSAPPQFYFGSQNLQQPRNFPSFGTQDQFVLPPQQSPVLQPNSFRQPEREQSQSARHPENIQPQTYSQPESNPSQTFSQPESNPPQTFRQPENNPLQTFSQADNVRPQNMRQTENILPQTARRPDVMPPQTIGQSERRPQSFRHPENTNIQLFRQPEVTQAQAFGQTENTHPQTVRQRENIRPQTIRQPEFIQPQSIRQLQDSQLRNVPGVSFAQHEDGQRQRIRQLQSSDHNLPQNANTQNIPSNDQGTTIRNLRDRRLPENPVAQRFPGFNNPFFQEFPNFGALNFNEPFAQPQPYTYDLLLPPVTRFQEQFPPTQHIPNQERPQQAPQQLERPQVNPELSNPHRLQNSNQQQYQNHVRQQAPDTPITINQPETSAYAPQTNQNPNVIDAEKENQERSKPTKENIEPQLLLTLPQPPRTFRNRGKPTASSTYQSSRQRNRDQTSQHLSSRPQENTRTNERPQDPEQLSIQNHRRPQSEVVYRQQRPQEVSVSEIPNERHHRHPSPNTAVVPDFRLQESPHPQSIRDEQRDAVYNQRQPTRHRNRQYYYDNNNEQAIPQYSVQQHTPTTPIPSPPPRQRTRQPEQYPSREAYQNPRQVNVESTTPASDDRPFYGYRSSDPPPDRLRTSAPGYERSRDSAPPSSRPRTSATEYERSRVSSASPDRYRTSAPEYERPRDSALQYERSRVSPPSYERPRITSSTYESPRTRTSAAHHSQNLPVTSRYFVTSAPRFKPEEGANVRPHPQADAYPETHHERPRVRPQAQIERPPPDYVNAEPLAEDYPRAQRYHSHRPQNSPNAENDVNVISTADLDHRPRPTPSGTGRRPGYRGTSSERQASVPEIERGFLPVSERPPRHYTYSTRVPEKEYRQPDNERARGNRYQNYNEEIPTTKLATTPRTTKKPRPPPPRPTFPSFPTFPPPPRRFATSPSPRITEDPDSEREIPQTTENISDEPQTTQLTIDRSRPKVEIVTEIQESRQVVTENYLQTDVPEVTTRRRTRKRRPKQKRPKATTLQYDDEHVIQVETLTQASTNKETSTRSTPSNYNRWRQQTLPQRKTTAESSTEAPAAESLGKTEEYGSRINLFGRPRTRKPTSFAPRTPTTTPTPAFYEESRRSSKIPTATRTRKPFAKKVRKKTTTETPETTEPIARSDEHDDNRLIDINSLQGLESVTQLSIENLSENFQTTEPYNDVVETTMETTTLNDQYDLPENQDDNVENFESTRSVSRKFQNRRRVLKFGKPRLRTTNSPLDLNGAESKFLR